MARPLPRRWKAPAPTWTAQARANVIAYWLAAPMDRVNRRRVVEDALQVLHDEQTRINST